MAQSCQFIFSFCYFYHITAVWLNDNLCYCFFFISRTIFLWSNIGLSYLAPELPRIIHNFFQLVRSLPHLVATTHIWPFCSPLILSMYVKTPCESVPFTLLKKKPFGYQKSKGEWKGYFKSELFLNLDRNCESKG